MLFHRTPKKACFVLAGCILAVVTGCGEDAPLPPRGAADLRYAALDSRISFTHPWFDSPSGQTAHVGLGVDGQGVGRCDKDAHDDRTVCLESALVPGSHVIAVDFSYAEGGQARTEHVRIEEHLVVGTNEHVLVDLSKVQTGDPAKYITRKKPGEGGSACDVAVTALAAAPTCTAADLANVATQLNSAEAACGSLSSAEELRAGGTAAYAFDNLFALKPDRCFTAPVMSRVPRILTATAGDERWWPQGTLKLGSWGWAHDVIPPGFDEIDRTQAGATKTKLGLAKAAVAQLIERVSTVEDFTTAYESSKKPQAAIDKALRDPFDLDPRTTPGHRMHLLLHGPDFARARGDKESFYDDKLAEFVTRSIPRMTTLNCGPTQQAPLVLRYLFSDKKLTREEWAATQSLVQRTPPDARLVDACREAASDTLTSDVSQSDRVRWFTAADCSERRLPGVRGDAARALLAPSSTKVPAELRTRVRTEFAACLGKDEPE